MRMDKTEIMEAVPEGGRQEMTKSKALGYTIEIEDAEKAGEMFRDIARKMLLPAEEVTDAVCNALRELPPIGEAEIAMIRCNPSLSWIQKWWLIRSIRKDQRRRKEMMR